MPTQCYSYLGIDRCGRNVAGRMIADDEANLEAKLHRIGLWLVEAKGEGAQRRDRAAQSQWRRWGRSSRRDLINFCTLIAFELKAGIPMVTAIQVASDDCEHAKFKRLLQELKRQVEAGLPLWEAMQRFPRVFSQQFISLVRAGEHSSALPETFLEEKRYLEWQEQVAADVRQASIYPAIVLIVVSLFVLLLFTYVVPKFVLLLSAVNVPLPLPTRVVFGVSDFAKATWWAWVVGLTGVPMAVQVARRCSEGFAIGFDRVKFRLPVFGKLMHLLAISQFAHNLAVLYRAGIIITEALKLCQGLVGSAWLAKVIGELAQRVEGGEPLSEGMRDYELFPPLLLRMAVMGENTGSLDQALENVSDYYNVLIPRQIKRIFAIVEPGLIVFLIGVVGTVALAVFMPIITLMGSIR